MKTKALITFVLGITVLMVTPGKGAENKASGRKRGPVKLTFIEEAKLSTAEVAQVLTLARQCGLTNAAEVETYYLEPGLGREIRVKSMERRSGRRLSHQEIAVGRDGWDLRKPDKGAKRVGEFFVNEPYPITFHFRVYEINKKEVKIRVEEKFDATLADKIILLFQKGKVRFKQDFERDEYQGFDLSNADGLYESDSGKGYELRLTTPMRILIFEVKEEEILIAGIGHYVF